MKFELTDDKKYLKLVDANELELRQLEISFTKTIRNYWILMKKNPKLKQWGWTGKSTFFKNNRIPIGLWEEVLKVCEKYKFECDITGLENIIDYNFDKDDFVKWQSEFFKDSERKPYDYQINTAYKIIKYGWSSNELATSAGKTLIVFMIFAYLKTHSRLNRMLIIVPSNSLVIQGINDFEDYSNSKQLLNYKMQPIGGGADKTKKDVDIVIGTFQTLRELPNEFFEDFNVVCVDEAHSIGCTSVKKVLSKCRNANIRFGLSGTLGVNKDDADSYTILSLIGPLINKVSANYLFGDNEGDKQYATPVYIRQIVMDYLSYDKRDDILKLKAKKIEFDGSTMLALERKIIIENKDRLDFIVDVISKVKKNSLILFHNVQDGYGKQICEQLKKILPNNYDIFYVDGETSQDLRNHYKEQMDKKTKSIKLMVASFGTFSTGISIKNLSYVFLTESFKSERIILQSIGRGMRLFEGKEILNVIDFVDDFSYKGYNNYSLKHSFEREDMYIAQGFPLKKITKVFGDRL